MGIDNEPYRWYTKGAWGYGFRFFCANERHTFAYKSLGIYQRNVTLSKHEPVGIQALVFSGKECSCDG